MSPQIYSNKKMEYFKINHNIMTNIINKYHSIISQLIIKVKTLIIIKISQKMITLTKQ